MCCYFDDFPCVSFNAMASMSQFAFEKALGILAIRFSFKLRKMLPFCRRFTMLGVQISFPEEYLSATAIKIENTKDRKDEIEECIGCIIDKGMLSQSVASSLAGRIGFLSSQAWSWAGSTLASSIRARADDKTSINTINNEIRDALLAAMTLVRAPPKHVKVNHFHATRWVFSDAAVEPDGQGSHHWRSSSRR